VAAAHRGFSENFASINRGKRSVALDLKSPADLETARALVAGRRRAAREQPPRRDAAPGPGLGLVRPAQAGLVYCSISAYGQDGPRGNEGGFDLTIQAAAGVMSVTGEPDGAPVKAGVPLSGLRLRPVRGLQHRLHAEPGARRRCRRPRRRVDVRGHAGHLGAADQRVLRHRAQPGKLGSAHPRNAPYQAYARPTAGLPSPPATTSCGSLCATWCPRPELLDDQRFTTPTLRARHQRELKALLDPHFALRSPCSTGWIGLRRRRRALRADQRLCRGAG
jgi:crotonobetainyl-CoA:carnitine CoA-transferase CaiB-like acyl-CoA transferase